MYMKTHILAALREEFDHWERVLANLSEAQITAVPQPGEMSIKDEIAHLWAWQQRSIARMEAGVDNTEPQMPPWWPDATVTRADAAVDHEEINDRINAQIYELYRDHTWAEVYAQWRAAFHHFLNVSEQVPEPALLDASRFAWLSGYSLADVLLGSYDHHQEHLDGLMARMG
ncbi:MAG: DinB family protein [Caldilineaceae bacterium]